MMFILNFTKCIEHIDMSGTLYLQKPQVWELYSIISSLIKAREAEKIFW